MEGQGGNSNSGSLYDDKILQLLHTEMRVNLGKKDMNIYKSYRKLALKLKIRTKHTQKRKRKKKEKKTADNI